MNCLCLLYFSVEETFLTEQEKLQLEQYKKRQLAFQTADTEIAKAIFILDHYVSFQLGRR